MTTFNTGSQVNQPLYQYNWKVVLPLVQTSVAYDYSYGGSRVWRSNAGVAMTDTLPNPDNSSADNEPAALWNGWFLDILNIDTTASLTISVPTGYSYNGVLNATITLTPGAAVSIYTDGNNFFSMPSGGSYMPFVLKTGSPINLGTIASGSIVNRSNSTTAMADTLPNANTLPIGWNIWVKNVDASATDTITPATSTINGGATLAITFGKATFIWADGTNYWATTPT